MLLDEKVEVFEEDQLPFLESKGRYHSAFHIFKVALGLTRYRGGALVLIIVKFAVGSCKEDNGGTALTSSSLESFHA